MMIGGMATTRATIRPARVEEAATLSALALRAKAHWGYDEAFMGVARPAMVLSPDDVEVADTWIAEDGSGPLGFYQLTPTVPEARLDDLFLEPRAIGRGIGRLLWEHAVERARRHGATSLILDADPNAEGFYLRMGAERVSETESPLFPGRTLPVMRIALGDRAVR